MATTIKDAQGHKKLTGTDKVKQALPAMLKGGVIMDVVNAEQAKIAEEAGAVAVMRRYTDYAGSTRATRKYGWGRLRLCDCGTPARQPFCRARRNALGVD